VNTTGATGEQLADAIEQNRALDEQLSEAEKANASWEAKVRSTDIKVLIVVS